MHAIGWQSRSEVRAPMFLSGPRRDHARYFLVCVRFPRAGSDSFGTDSLPNVHNPLRFENVARRRAASLAKRHSHLKRRPARAARAAATKLQLGPGVASTPGRQAAALLRCSRGPRGPRAVT
jgi:hypothetical protein